MRNYILKRVLLSLLTLLAITLVLFILLQLMPGSPFNDEKLTPPARRAERKIRPRSAHLRPIFQVCREPFEGGFRRQLQHQQEHADQPADPEPAAHQLWDRVAAVALGAAAGLILGVVAALKHNTLWDTLCTVISVWGYPSPAMCLPWG